MTKREEMKKNMLFLCIHSTNPNRPDFPSKEEWLPRREKNMKAMMEKGLPVKSIFSVSNDDRSRMWCVWEADNLESLKAIMDPIQTTHTEIIPVWRVPQVM
jgi:hypothetical protein